MSPVRNNDEEVTLMSDKEDSVFIKHSRIAVRRFLQDMLEEKFGDVATNYEYIIQNLCLGDLEDLARLSYSANSFNELFICFLHGKIAIMNDEA